MTATSLQSFCNWYAHSIGARDEQKFKRGRCRCDHYRNGNRMSEPEKAINLLWAVDEIIIALQQLRERLRRLAERDGPPRKPKTRS